MRWVGFKVCLIASDEVLVVFNLVGFIAFDVFRFLSSAYKSHMFPFLAVLVLGDAKIHTGSTNGGNMAFYIKATVNEGFSYWPILEVLDININNSQVRLGGNFDNVRKRCDVYIFKNMSGFDSWFNISWINSQTSAFYEIE